MLVLLVGALLLGTGVFIGLPFTGIYLLGFIANAGREAGRELLIFLPMTIVVCGVGYGLMKLGNRIRKP
ncbi:MAG: hypothetical protein JNJ89_02795 [Rubrivivax sp.]|nr:hypothetical protein [Rubrivivax sp.]